MGGHLRLTRQSQMYLFVSIGTFEIDWLVSNVPCQSHLSPTPLGGWAPMGGQLRLTVNLKCPLCQWRDI